MNNNNNAMDQNQPLKRRIIEQQILIAPQRTYVNPPSTPQYQQQPRSEQYYQLIPLTEPKPQIHQIQQIIQPQSHQQPHQQPPPQQREQPQLQRQQPQQQPHYHQEPQQQQSLQPHQQYHHHEAERKPPPQVMHYEYDEKPMMLNAWTQTSSDEYPSLSDGLQRKVLLAKVRELEARVEAQANLINHMTSAGLRPELRTPTPTRAIPSSTTTPPKNLEAESTTYRILAQGGGATNGDQIEIELSNEDIPRNLNFSEDSDRLEICLSEDNQSSPRTPSRNIERPDLENATVSIGPNGTQIPVGCYEKMSWATASLATRKLLTLVFDRETLATHSMTGKPSPAFKDLDKPIKGRLDPKAINDIIFIVSQKCGVSKKEVRAAITTKCADENKMIKLRALKEMGGQNPKRSALKEVNVKNEQP